MNLVEDKNSSDSGEDNFFEKMENAPANFPSRKLVRSKNNIMIAGVCSGIAAHLKIDVANVRLIAILSLFIGGWSIVAYLLAAMLLPYDVSPEQINNEESENQRRENLKVLVSGILLLIGFYYAFQKIGFNNTGRLFVFPTSFMIPVISVSVGIYLLLRRGISNTVYQQKTVELFYRSKQNRWLLGVCGGFSKYLNTDAGSIRVLVIILTLLTLGLFSVAYIIVALQTKFENQNLNEI